MIPKDISPPAREVGASPDEKAAREAVLRENVGVEVALDKGTVSYVIPLVTPPSMIIAPHRKQRRLRRKDYLLKRNS